MIAACPSCSARYKIDVSRLRPEGARLRCARCEAIFRVRPPAAEEGAPPAPAPPAREPQPLPAARDPRRLVLIADPGVESGKATASALASWGLETMLVHDGVEAILSVQRALPAAVVIDAALPKMFGFQVCELMKRNESLRAIHVVLVGAIHDRERYRRSPTELYGADAYVERPQLPEALRSILRNFGLPVQERASGATAPAPAPRQAPPAQPAPAPARPAPEPPPRAPADARNEYRDAPAPRAPSPAPASSAPAAPAPAAPTAPAAPAASEETAQAERLARIVVSDIVLYNPEKFEAGLAAGNVVEALEAELAEGRALLEQRIGPALRTQRDLLVEELLRVARERERR